MGKGGTSTGDPGVEGSSESSEDGSVFAPDPRASGSNDGPGSTSGGDLGETIGKGDTTTQTGESRTSLREAIRRYSDDAARVARQPGLPSAHRQLISDYFARLSGAS
ncbi:MAG: hypothetical protein V9F03_07310 [Microthrixaceae bacterium]